MFPREKLKSVQNSYHSTHITLYVLLTLNVSKYIDSVVIIFACHTVDPGSNLAVSILSLTRHLLLWHEPFIETRREDPDLLLWHEPLVETRPEEPDWKEEGRCRRGILKMGLARLSLKNCPKNCQPP